MIINDIQWPHQRKSMRMGMHEHGFNMFQCLILSCNLFAGAGFRAKELGQDLLFTPVLSRWSWENSSMAELQPTFAHSCSFICLRGDAWSWDGLPGLGDIRRPCVIDCDRLQGLGLPGLYWFHVLDLS